MLVLVAAAGTASAQGAPGVHFITSNRGFLIKNEALNKCLVAGSDPTKMVDCKQTGDQVWHTDLFQSPSRLKSAVNGLCLHEETFQWADHPMVACEESAKQWYWDATNFRIAAKDSGAHADYGICDPNAPISTGLQVPDLNPPPPGHRSPECGEVEYLVGYGGELAGLTPYPDAEGQHARWILEPVH